MSARLLALAAALLLALAQGPARAGMSYYGTKNFTPAPGTPSYFIGERGGAYPEMRDYRGSAARAAASLRGDLYARPTRPRHRWTAAAARPAYRAWTRTAYARSGYYRSRYYRSRAWRLARWRRLRELRLARLRRLRELRLARLRALRRENDWR